ncbi:hypothetical protein C0J52_23932 [Blattella germanica]|nr:hypothetical protein C0J52_23932 [Blattella germanica]
MLPVTGKACCRHTEERCVAAIKAIFKIKKLEKLSLDSTSPLLPQEGTSSMLCDQKDLDPPYPRKPQETGSSVGILSKESPANI